MNQVVDLDIVRPEKSEIIIDGKEYDLTIIPWSIGLRMYDLMPAITELEKTGNITSEDYHSVLEIILDCLKLTDESLTIDWIDRWMADIPPKLLWQVGQTEKYFRQVLCNLSPMLNKK